MERGYRAWDHALLDISATKEWRPHASIDYAALATSNSGRTPGMAAELLSGSVL